MQSTFNQTAISPRKVWTRKEAHALVDAGFPNAEKLELIEGELINRMGKGHLHMLWQNLVQRWLVSVFGWDFVRSEGSTDVAQNDNEHSEPEPDLMVTKRAIRDYDAIPTAGEQRLLVEISDSTLDLDLKVKSKLYARAEIPEYWVIDVRAKEIVVHREPVGGAYSNVATYSSKDEISPISAPDARFCLDLL